MKILYVEDDPRDADLTMRVLAKTAPHLQMETVSTIRDAQARLSSEPCDLLLTDMHLRDGNGLSLLRYVRESGLPIAVVVVTGMGDEETAVEALKARADDYLVKHKDYIDRLPIALESALNHYRADAARRARPLYVLYVGNGTLDIDDIRGHLNTHASHIHFEVATTWSEALATMESYDVLLMNFQASDMNALEALRALRLTHKKDIPVVLLCNSNVKDLALQAVKLGVSSYLIKSPGYLYYLPWQLEDAHSRIELIRREAALNASEARNRAILNAIPDLMFLMSRDGTYLDYHATHSDLLILPPDQFLGKKMQEVLPPEVAMRLTKPFERALESDQPVVVEYEVELPAGRRVFEASMVSCEGDKVLSMVRDITERKLAEESLKNALAEVELLKDRLHEENVYLQEEIRVASNFGEIVGASNALRKVLSQAEQVAPADTTVLILGETGTGKELLAHAIHSRSPRSKRTLVKVNCATLPAPLIESELFGHVKGAFTGAANQRLGRFQIADGGTIFLDEVGEMPLDLQAKLLRVLEEGEFEPVGSSQTRKVNVRIIAATNRDLAAAVRKGNFRADLYYRLSIYPITLPPLRERSEDIPMLVTHLIKHFSAKLGKHIDTIPQKTMTALKEYSWPGNVRELRNVLERAAIVTSGSQLRLADPLDAVVPKGKREEETGEAQLTLDGEHETLEQSKFNLILRTLKKVHWRVEGVGGAADLLKVNPNTLRTHMKKLGITKPRID